MLVSKDALLADLSRALKAHHAESADQMLAVLEPALTAGSPTETKPKKSKGPPKKLSGAIGKYAAQAGEALAAAFPDRGASLAEQFRMQVALGRIARWIEGNRPAFHKELRKGASEKSIAKLEKIVGQKLPIALHALWRWHDGNDGYSGFYENNSLATVESSGSNWGIMDDLIEQFEEEGSGKDQTWWRRGWIPFLENGGGDMIVVDLEGTFTKKKEQVLQFWHDDGPRTVIFPDLVTWAEVYATSLESGVWTYDDDEDGDGDVDWNQKAFDKLVSAAAKGYPKEFEAD